MQSNINSLWLYISVLLMLPAFGFNVFAQFQQTSGPCGGVVETIIYHQGVLLAGTSGAGVFRSEDGGTNWLPSNTGLQDLHVWCFAENDSIIYAGTTFGLFQSIDGGSTWAGSGISTQITTITIQGSYIFAGTACNGVFRSEIGTNTWVIKNSGLNNLFITSMVSYDTLLYAGTWDGVFVTENDGNNWTSSGLISYSVNTLAVHQSVVFAGVTGNGGLYKSLAGTNNWLYSGMGMNLGESINAIEVTGGIMYAGSAQHGVYQSVNSGNSWIMMNSGLSELYVLSLEHFDSTLIAGTSGGGVFVFNIQDNSWIPTNAGFIATMIQAFIPVGSALMCGTGYSRLFSSDNFGSTWDATGAGLPSTPVFSLLQKGESLFCGTGNGVFKSTDQGQTWFYSGLISNTYAMEDLSGKIFAGTGNGMYISADSGITWIPSNSGFPASPGIRSLMKSENFLFAGLSGHGMYLSQDQGNTWAARNSGLIAGLTVNSITSTDSLIFAGTNYGVYRTSDLGTTWTQVISGLGSYAVNVLTRAADGILAGTTNGLFFTRNNGDSWINVSDGLAERDIRAIAVIDGLVYAGTSHSGVWSNPLWVITGGTRNQLTKQFLVFPNPVQNVLTIQSLNSGGKIKAIYIHDAKGVCVFKILLEKMKSMESIDISNLQRGCFYISVEGTDIVNTNRLIVY